MKFSCGIFSLLLAGGIAASDGMTIRGGSEHARKLMASSRRIEENQAQGNYNYGQYSNYNGYNQYADMNDEERSLYFLRDYSIKLLSCIQGEQVVSYEGGETEGSTVIFRLCPTNSCSADSVLGCNDGYGDYIVGVNTFLKAYIESQEDNENGNSMIAYNQYEQEFDASEYVDCKEYDIQEMDEEQQEKDQQQQYQQYQYGNGNQNQYYQNGQYQQYQQKNGNGQQGGQNYYNGVNNYYQEAKFFIGPGCTDDGTAVALHMYQDQKCSYRASVNFTDISPGWRTLPFSEGDLVQVNCMPCYTVDGDYEMELSEMCQEEYASAVASCEQNMEDTNYYHYAVNNGCNYIENLLSKTLGDLDSYYIESTEEESESEIENESASAYSSNFTANFTSWDGIKGTISHAAQDGAQKAKTRFMDTLSTREAQLFIAAMVIFSISACVGATLIGCFCAKKRRQRRRLKEPTLLEEDDEEDEEEQPERHSSMVSMVRSATSSFKDSVKAAISRSNTKEDDQTAISEYKDMGEGVVSMDSFPSPETVPSGAASVKSTLSAAAASVKSSLSVAAASVKSTLNAEAVEATAEASEGEVAGDEAFEDEATSTAEAKPTEPSTAVAVATTATPGESTTPVKKEFSFFSKMDRHLKRKFSKKTQSK
mmetsp:Transcript_4065/g.11653  ORF Transcript_4065/g.11653 Transcript_4065/m.11653 type:complete len:651 (-) Transcript_4065:1181-3133(-)